MFFPRKNHYFEASGGPSWELKSIKNRLNWKSKLECLLASIFIGFWRVLGGKLGGKMEPKSIEKGIKNVMKI